MASSRRTSTNESKWSNPGGSGSWSAGVNTFGTAGAGRDYTAVSLWETDSDVNLTSATVSPVLECYADSASYTLSEGIWGATTSASYKRILRAPSGQRHLGAPSAGVIFTGTMYTSENYSSVQDVSFNVTANSSSSAYALGKLGGTAYNEFVGLLLHATNSGSGTGYGFFSENGRHYLVNCIAWECEGYGFNTASSGYQQLKNCTAVSNGGYGFTGDASFPGYVINCLGTGNSSGDFASVSWDATSTHNVSGDATAPALNTYYRSKTISFNNAAGDDYRLASTDTDAIGKGTDLSADANWAFDDDIAFTTRS